MSAFLDRFLPANERATALWLALGGAAVTVGAAQLGSTVLTELPVGTDGSAMPLGVAYVVQALAQFALVTLVVALLIRFARAPKVLALYLLLGGLLNAIIGVLGLPGDYILSARNAEAGLLGTGSDPLLATMASVLVSLGVGLGAVAGAWVASTVTLARIRDTGFSGDDPQSDGLQRKPGPRGAGFLGWEGSPPSGDALVAVALVAMAIIPSLVTTAASLMIAVVPGDSWAGGDGIVQAVLWALLITIAWFFSAWVVTLRTGVVSAWVVTIGELFSTVLYIAENAIATSDVRVVLYASAASLLPAILLVAAALLGTAFALRR